MAAGKYIKFKKTKKSGKYYKAKAQKNKDAYLKLKKLNSAATRREVGDFDAEKTLIYRQPLFKKQSQLVKNMVYYVPAQGISSLANAPQLFYKANDNYDPYDGALGNQPIAHKEMMTFYEHFCVIRSNLTVTFTNPSETATFRVGIVLCPDTSTMDYRKLMENGLLKTAVLGPSISATSVKKLSIACDVKKYFGSKNYREMLRDERLVGDLNASPFERVHYGIFVIPAFQSTNVDVICDSILCNDAIYFEPKKLTPN